jgi:hypothetical protein
VTATQVHQGGSAQDYQPDRSARRYQDAVHTLRGHRRGERTPVWEISATGHQQLVCAALLVLDETTVPSLVVIEQLSLLTRKKLDARTEPNSDREIGVTVSDHGM